MVAMYLIIAMTFPTFHTLNVIANCQLSMSKSACYQLAILLKQPQSGHMPDTVLSSTVITKFKISLKCANCLTLPLNQKDTSKQYTDTIF